MAPARMYDAKNQILVQKDAGAKKEASVGSMWVLPVLFVAGMFSLAALVVKRTRKRSTRQIQVVSPAASEEYAHELLPDGADSGLE